MNTYRLIIINTVLILLLNISGCGFQLRQSPALANQLTHISVDHDGINATFVGLLKQQLKAEGVEVLPKTETTYQLQLLNYESARHILSVKTDGKVAEYELISSLRYSLESASGSTLINEHKINSRFTYLASDYNVLGKNQEENDIRDNMNQELIRKLLRQLSRAISQ